MLRARKRLSCDKAFFVEPSIRTRSTSVTSGETVLAGCGYRKTSSECDAVMELPKLAG
jgi:hypothetical protein